MQNQARAGRARGRNPHSLSAGQSVDREKRDRLQELKHHGERQRKDQGHGENQNLQNQCHRRNSQSREEGRTHQKTVIYDQGNTDAQSQKGNAGRPRQKGHQSQ